MQKRSIGNFILCMAIILFVVYRYRVLIYEYINEYFYTDYVLEELTMEEKVEDFESFYTTLEESVPFLEDIEALYNINFVERKEYYRSEVEGTKNNFEFFCVMKAISKEIPSFHTDICFPFYENLQGLGCYDSEEIVNYPGTKARVDAWFEEIGNYVWEYQEMGFLSAVYVDGDYIVNGNTLPDSYGDLENWELVTVDGMDIEQYVTERISVYDLHYDSANDKPYRDRVVFNDSVGRQVETVWQSESGEKITLHLYADCGAEVVAGFGYIYTGVGCPSAIASVEMYRDDENQLEYIAVNDFVNNSGDKLKEYLENTVYDKIVIDLRNNYGGLSKYGQKYLYPLLHAEDAVLTFQWKVPASKANEAMNKNFTAWWNFYEGKDGEFYYYEDRITYNGKQNAQKEVYYLAGEGSGSAADTYLTMIKENSLGTIVGTNSGGEGLGTSFVCKKLENSSLIYVYYPSVSIQRGEDYNSCLGTQPDVYINQSREDFILQQQFRQSDGVGVYENMLQYDTALKWVIQQ